MTHPPVRPFRGTQNPVGFTPRVGSIPTSGTSHIAEVHKGSRTRRGAGTLRRWRVTDLPLLPPSRDAGAGAPLGGLVPAALFLAGDAVLELEPASARGE